MVNRYNRRVLFTWKNQLREPDPADVMKFVDKEIDVNDSLYSGEAVDQKIERKEREGRSSSKRD